MLSSHLIFLIYLEKKILFGSSTLNLNPEVAVISSYSPTNNLLKISNPNITAWNPKDNYVNKKNNNEFLMNTIGTLYHLNVAFEITLPCLENSIDLIVSISFQKHIP